MKQRVLVTGANKGIGRAICELLLEKHPNIQVLLGSRNAQRGQEAIQEITAKLGADVCSDRLELVSIDTSSDASVQEAAKQEAQRGSSLYGIINNAGVGYGNSLDDTLNINYHGVKRVNTAFGPLLKKPGGRIVHVSSASGPMFVASCSDTTIKSKLTNPTSIEGLDEIAASPPNISAGDVYGLSKALLNAYTVLLAQQEPDWIINSCTPGFIATDLTSGMGASNPPSKGAIPPVHLLMSDEIAKLPTGRYYGSDCVRSPLFEYRGPGDPPYEGP